MSITSLDTPPRLLRLVRGSSDQNEAMQDRSPAVRLRPGERPIWIALNLSARDVGRIRASANRAGLSVDALMALAIEWMLLTQDLRQVEERLQEAAHRAETCVRLAPTPALREWTDLLGRHPESGIDALPELLLPERLLARWRPEAESALRALAELPLPLAIAAERAAASAGLTLTEWSYRSAFLLA